MKLDIDWNALLKALWKAAKCTEESEAFGGNPRKEHRD